MRSETQSESGLPSGAAHQLRTPSVKKRRTRSIENKDDVLAKRLALAISPFEHVEDEIRISLLFLLAQNRREDRRGEGSATVVRGDGDRRDHELLVENDDELDEAIVERLVLGVASSFDQSEEVRDEVV